MASNAKKPVSFRLSEEARRLIRELSADLGIGPSAVIEVAVREKATNGAEGLEESQANQYYKNTMSATATTKRRKTESLKAVFGRNVRKWREHKKLTQTELAKRAGVRQPEISSIEHGRYAPTMASVERIAKALGVSPGELLSDSGPPGTV